MEAAVPGGPRGAFGVRSGAGHVPQVHRAIVGPAQQQVAARSLRDGWRGGGGGVERGQTVDAKSERAGHGKG